MKLTKDDLASAELCVRANAAHTSETAHGYRIDGDERRAAELMAKVAQYKALASRLRRAWQSMKDGAK